ncbi:MAG: hypothetical protein ACLRIS_00345 [Flavonifractor plautii]
MQSKKKTILAVAALVVIAAVLLLVWRAVTPKGRQGKRPSPFRFCIRAGRNGCSPWRPGRPIWARS